jgi:hypothetical protein
VPDSLKTKAQLDQISRALNHIRENRHEYLMKISNWELKDIEQAIWDFSREVKNLRIHGEFSTAKIFKEEISLYKSVRWRKRKNIAT